VTSGAVPINEPETAPVQHCKAQDATLLSVIRKMKLDPKRLPKNPSGKQGVKVKVRQALKDNTLFAGSTVFNKSWERLTKFGDIVISKVSP
jgi:hypothetical protein